ncbi:MAG: DUF4390 domain-containing protein [Desulfobacterales bacterium]|nr:DUF4390 domain-containing protein [Desulfobacterales bacterium]
MLKLLVVGIAIILFAVASPVCVAQGAEALIEDLRIERENGALLVSFSVKNCFSKKIEEAIKAGIPTTFNFFVTLYKNRALVWDKKVASHKFRHRIIYDTLKEDFRVWLQEKGKEMRVADLEEAKRSMQLVEGFPVLKGQELEKGDYELAVKAELDPVKLPLRLEGILFFVSLWDFETDWCHRTMRVEP